ncbi:MAG: M20/M25/M40 family metallo-hydrolase [Thermoanaerobaculia bacterium]|jgi:acetylornithine deacetylase/succinyl-diaminopimelate desuccinylase-like protein
MSVVKKWSSSFRLIVALAIVVFVALLVNAWRISRPLEDSTYIPRKEIITPEIVLLQEYIRIDTSNPPGNELEGARFLVRELARRGVTAELIESAPGRANVYARIRGKNPGGGLLLLHHIDVVPADPRGWSEPPFAAKTKLNMLYGRGALDMKSFGISQLLAFAELAATGAQPERDVVFLAVADEEEGGKLGVAWLLEHRPDVFEGVAFALNEGGISETLKEVPSYFGIEVGTRQLVKLRVRAKARRPLELARTALLPLQNPRDPDEILPEVPAILRNTAQYRIADRELLSDVQKTISNGDFYRLQPVYRSLLISAASLEGVMPDPEGGFMMDVTMNNLPDVQPDDSIMHVSKLVEPYGVAIDVVSVQGPSPITPTDTRLFELIREEVVHEYGAKVFVGPIILPFSSNDSRYLRPLGIRAYGFCPYPVSLYHTWGIHGVDERVRLDWFVDGVNLTRRLVRRFAAEQ